MFLLCAIFDEQGYKVLPSHFQRKFQQNHPVVVLGQHVRAVLDE
jgi:hypothetical protein